MPLTPNLALPLIAAAQAQKHVTHKDGLGPQAKKNPLDCPVS
jgi:hypothetical protein